MAELVDASDLKSDGGNLHPSSTLGMPTNNKHWACGGIGIRNRLKICREYSLVGSSPTKPTNKNRYICILNVNISIFL